MDHCYRQGCGHNAEDHDEGGCYRCECHRVKEWTPTDWSSATLRPVFPWD